MKIWILDTQTLTHRLVRFSCGEHSDYQYIGDLVDEDLESLFLDIQPDMDLDKNMKLIKYYGYLHLFIISKK